MPEVVVTGLGFITSIGNSKGAVTGNLRDLKHGFERYEPFQNEDIPVKLTGTIKDFDTSSNEGEDWIYPQKYKVKREFLRSLSPHGLYANCALVQAIEDAGWTEEDISHPRTGLYTASSGSARGIHYHLGIMEKRGVLRCSPMGVISSIAGTLNFNLVSRFQIQGSSCGFVSACASSGHALGFACDEIMRGRQDRMIVVGAEDGNLESILPFAGMRALSLSDDPDTASKPFDVHRKGFVGTGGAVAMLLESGSAARERGSRIYAEFVGWGQGSDGHHAAQSHPEGKGMVLAIENALRETGLASEEVDYINAHAPSTLTGDISEIRALKKVFGGCQNPPAISSTKALTGHGLSLSSIMEAGFCMLAFEEDFLPGSAHIEKLDPEAESLNIIRQSQERSPKVILSNSSGFGGANVALLFRSVNAN